MNLEVTLEKQVQQGLIECVDGAPWDAFLIYVGRLIERKRDTLEKGDSDIARGELKAFRGLQQLREKLKKDGQAAALDAAEEG